MNQSMHVRMIQNTLKIIYTNFFSFSSSLTFHIIINIIDSFNKYNKYKHIPLFRNFQLTVSDDIGQMTRTLAEFYMNLAEIGWFFAFFREEQKKHFPFAKTINTVLIATRIRFYR